MEFILRLMLFLIIFCVLSVEWQDWHFRQVPKKLIEILCNIIIWKLYYMEKITGIYQGIYQIFIDGVDKIIQGIKQTAESERKELTFIMIDDKWIVYPKYPTFLKGNNISENKNDSNEKK